MSNYYNLDGIKTQLKKDIDLKESYLKAWLNVEICTKKDGTPFKNMGKNFKNATYKQNYDVYQYELTIYVYPTDLNGYSNDSIQCYLSTHYDNNPVIKSKPENIMKVPYCYDIYIMDIDDIKIAINDHIEYLKDSIEKLKLQLENADKIYAMFKKDYTDCVKKLENECNEISVGYSALFHMVKDTVIERYPYC